MRYFVRLSSYLQLKNNLHKEIYKYLSEDIDRTVVGAGSLVEFVERLRLQINVLNSRYPRCKPVEVHFYLTSLDIEEDIHVYICGNLFTLCLYRMR